MAKSFEEFVKSQPEPPSSAVVHEEPAAGDAAPPKEDEAGADQAPAASPAPERKPKFSIRRSSASSSEKTGSQSTESQTPVAAASKQAQPKSSGVSSSSPPAPDGGTHPSPNQAPTDREPVPQWVLEALRKGDLDAIAEAVEEDPALFHENTPRWAARNRKEAKLKAERDAIRQKAESVVQRTAPIFEEVQAVQSGRYDRLPALVELLLGEGFSWDDAVLKVARARHASDPRVPVLERQLQEERARAAEFEAQQVKSAERAFIEYIRDEVSQEDPIRKLPDWEQRVAKVLRDPDNFDPDLGEPKLSVAQAVRRVIRKEKEEFDRRAALFGEPPRPTPPPKKGGLERAARTGPAPVRRATKAEWLSKWSKEPD